MREKVMKKLFEVMCNDIKSENFTAKEVIVFGIVVPLLLVAVMGLAGWMDHLSGLV